MFPGPLLTSAKRELEQKKKKKRKKEPDSAALGSRARISPYLGNEAAAGIGPLPVLPPLVNC